MGPEYAGSGWEHLLYLALPVAGSAIWVVWILLRAWSLVRLGGGRQRAWMALAERLDADYEPEREFGVPASCPRGLFAPGDDWATHNIISGEYGGRQFRCFDYSATGVPEREDPYDEDERVRTGTPAPFGTVLRTYAVLSSGTLLPAMLIRPAGPLDRLTNAWLHEAVQFPSEEFNRRFVVMCADAKRARALITHQVATFLARQARPMMIEMEGQSVVFTYRRAGLTQVPDGVMALLMGATTFLDRVEMR